MRKLQTNGVAFHSPLLDGCLDGLQAGGRFFLLGLCNINLLVARLT